MEAPAGCQQKRRALFFTRKFAALLECRASSDTIGAVRSFLKISIVVVILGAMLPSPATNGMTDEEKKQMFLKAREEMQTVEEPTPAPSVTPKPKPATHHTPTPVPATPAPSPTPRAGSPTPHPQTTPPRETPRPTAVPATPVQTPAPIPTIAPRETPVVHVIKPEIQNEPEPPPPPEPHGFWPWSRPVNYRYLTRSVIDAIRNAPVARSRWRNIVVHNSGTRQGNAKIFDYYHLHTRHMPNGLAYHFVIGNGSSSGDGEIEIGGRWTKQLDGGHVHSDFLNHISLGICLVGDFNRDQPTKAQLAALDELIRYLRTRVGKFDGHVAVVWAHREINPVPTDCPGNLFPYRWLHSTYDIPGVHQ